MVSENWGRGTACARCDPPVMLILPPVAAGARESCPVPLPFAGPALTLPLDRPLLARVHVDAAYAGVFACLPDQHDLYFQGLEGVDSFSTNPHKGMLVTFDWCGGRVRCLIRGAAKVFP